MKQIDCFIACSQEKMFDSLYNKYSTHALVGKVFFLSSGDTGGSGKAYSVLPFQGYFSTELVKEIASLSSSAYTLLVTQENTIEFLPDALDRMLSICSDLDAGMVYSNYHSLTEGKRSAHPLIDYQPGSLRDDFDFGPVLLFSQKHMLKALSVQMNASTFAGLYQLRLHLSLHASIFRIQEYLYTAELTDTRASGKKIFDYVDPRNRAVQIEMEEVFTEYLKYAGAFLSGDVKKIVFDQTGFKTEASIIIPVLNRKLTIADAIESVMKQKTDFSFNLIIVDNHSSDGTTEIISEYAAKYKNLIHIIPKSHDLGIGGCWNLGVADERCGRFAVQLDSDDLYIDESTLQKIVNLFHKDHCAMVIGSYRMTNFDLEEIPPGLIDHKEWTAENGKNNVLRINGLGAPRAFYTPLLRENKLPNVNYGEDYGIGLKFSRDYAIGRIYEALYLCRRWDDNSDASLSIEQVNKNNYYKDSLRSIEFAARMNKNKSGR